MQRDYWNDFYQTGKVSDYLKYADSAKNTWNGENTDKTGNSQSRQMESSDHAGKSDRNGAFGYSGW